MIRFFSLILLLLPFLLAGQDEIPVPKEKRFGIGLVPQYAITSGTRIDFDIRLPGRNQWLVVAPQLYLVTENSNLWNFNEMTGVGIDLQHRVFIGQGKDPRGAYLAYGPVLQYRSVRDEGLTSYQYREDDATYFGLHEEMMQTGIWKTGGNLIFGYQALASRSVYFDFYLGTGIRFSFDNRSSGLHGYYNEWWGDLGYSGTLMVGGFRFGLFL